MASARLVWIMCLMIGGACGQEGKCVASVQGVSSKPGLCPPTWTPWRGNCYKYTARKLTWQDARVECASMGGAMVLPQSQSETEFLYSFIPDGQELAPDHHWIDCQRKNDTWVCGETDADMDTMPWLQWKKDSDESLCSGECYVRAHIDPAKSLPHLHSENNLKTSYTVCKRVWTQVVSPKLLF